jgi:CHAT domain-containing protein
MHSVLTCFHYKLFRLRNDNLFKNAIKYFITNIYFFLAVLAASSPVMATATDSSSSAEIVSEKTGDPVLMLQMRAREASLGYDYIAAELALRKALVLRGNTPSTRISELDLLFDLAMVVASEGRFEEAAALLRRAGPIADRSTRESDRARLAGSRAIVAAGARDYGTALGYANEAAERWQAMAEAQSATGGAIQDGKTFPAIEAAMALNLEALMRLRSGDPTSAQALAGQALIAFDEAKGPNQLRADLLLTLGEASSVLGRLSAAEAYFTAALKIRETTGGAGVVRVRLAMGKAYSAEGMNTAAIISFREAIAIVRGMPRQAGLLTADDLIPFLDAVAEYGGSVTDESARTALYSEAFDAFELARARDGDKSNALAAARTIAPSPRAGAFLQQYQDANVDFDEQLRALAGEQSKFGDERDPLLEQAALQRLDAAGQVLATTTVQLASEFPDFAASTAPVTLDAVRARLGPNEATLSFLVGSQKVFVQVIRRDKIIVAPIALSRKELADQVGKLRDGLTIEGKSVNDFDLDLAWQFHERLFSGIADNLAGAERLVIVPSGPLANLPFGVLVTSQPRSGDYVGAKWLARDFDLMTLPSFATLVRLRSTRLTANQARPIFAVANPKFSPVRTALPSAPATAPAVFSGCPAAADQIARLEPLGETKDEVSSVIRSLGFDGNEVLSGNAATETALRSADLSQFRILYFATHAVLPGELRCLSRSALALAPESSGGSDSDGLFDTADIRRLSLRADLVVLSACNTAAKGDGPNGEGLASVADAFIAAGARSVFASYWKVPSRTTAQLFSLAFETMGRKRDTSADTALRIAQTEMMRDPRSAHPFFWAAFVAIGDGASSPLADRDLP